MSNYKRKVSDKQMILFTMDEIIPNEARRDKRPLPLIVAEKWQFPLTHIETDNSSDYLYCARDWYMGLGGDKAVWSRSKADWLTQSQPVMIETKRERRQPEMLEYVSEKGLYDIAQVMKVTKKNSERLQPIKDYLSISGVKLDEARRDKRKAKTLVKNIVQHHNPQRDNSKVQRKSFMQIATETHRNRNPKHGTLTNAIYHKLGKTVFEWTAKKEIAAILNLTPQEERHFRDHVNDLFLSAVTMAERASERAMQTSGGNLSDEQQLAIVRQCARIVAVSAYQLADVARVDLVTGKPLLASGSK